MRPDRNHGHTEGFGQPIDDAAPARVRRSFADMTSRRGRLGSIARVGNDNAIADLYNPIRLVGDLLIVRDQNDGVPLGVKLAQDLHNLCAAVCVQGPGRFIGQNYLAAIHQGAGDRYPLLLAARQLARDIARPLGQTQSVQQ